jgi:hypothetical protein
VPRNKDTGRNETPDQDAASCSGDARRTASPCARLIGLGGM